MSNFFCGETAGAGAKLDKYWLAYGAGRILRGLVVSNRAFRLTSVLAERGASLRGT